MTASRRRLLREDELFPDFICAAAGAETGITYHVEASSGLGQWTDIATYAGTNITLTAEATEVSRIGSPNETVTVRDTLGMPGQKARFLRVNVTRP